MHPCIRSLRVRPLPRFAVVVTLVTVSVGSLPGHASAAPAAQLWVSRYNGPGNYYDQATALGVSRDGSEVFVTGFVTGGDTSTYDYATVAYDATTGAEHWAKRYNGPGDSYDDATALGVSPDGSAVFVTGESSGSKTHSDYATIAYDAATGARLWVNRYDGPGSGLDYANALGVSPGGSTVFVTGGSHGSTSGYDFATVAYDAATGARLWVTRYNGPGNVGDSATALGVSPDGSTVFVTGGSHGSTSHSDYATVAYDAVTGAELWAKRYNGPGNGVEYDNALGVSLDGSEVFVTGSSVGSTSGYDYATVAYDTSTGAQLWARRYNGPANGGETARALGVSGSTVFVTGWSAASTFDYATVAYEASTGAELWAKRYNGPGNEGDFATAVGVSPRGSEVFVTGSSAGSTSNFDYATVTYDAATGAKLRADRYKGPGNGDDGASALGVSGSKVFVTGVVSGATSYDYGTIAYSAV